MGKHGLSLCVQQPDLSARYDLTADAKAHDL